MDYPQGQVVPITLNTTVSGVAADSTSLPTLVVEQPDETTVDLTVTHQGTGSYVADFTPTQTGLHNYHWTPAGVDLGAFDGAFNVLAEFPRLIIGVDEMRKYFRRTDVADDAMFEWLCAVVTAMVEDYTGPVVPKQVTEWFDGGQKDCVLSWQPVQSITSVTEYYGLSTFILTEQPLGSQTNAFAYTWDQATNQLMRRTYGGQAAYYAVGDKNVKVVYTAGRLNQPNDLAIARWGAIELARHLWEQTQYPGFSNVPRSDEGDLPDPQFSGFAMPNRVVDILQPIRRPVGIA